MCAVKVILAAGRGKNWRGWRGQPRKPQSPAVESGKGEQGMEAFETEQAPGLLIELDVGDKAKR